jgi:lipid-binding SYLF domain-containing protein
MRLLTGLILTAATVFAGEAENKRLQDAATVLTEIMATGDNAIPQHLLDKAECAVIVPGMKKGGFIVGAKYGRGFATCRLPSKAGWSAPSGVRIEGGSFGFQIGGAEVDIILLIMNKKGMERLTSSKFTVGGEASAAAGPVGRETVAQTDATMRAEILSWSRSRGLFGGIALNGATLRRDTDVDLALYGTSRPVLEILDGHAKAPAAAQTLLAALNKYSSRPNK